MKPISRREFLHVLTAGAGGLLLTACSQGEETVSTPVKEAQAPAVEVVDPAVQVESTGTAETTAPQQDNPEPTRAEASPAEPAQASPGKADLVIARGPDPEILVQRALAALGGMAMFVPKDAWVIIKPNICVAYHSYEYAATTNPWVVGALVRLAFEAGAKKVQVMDNPFGGTADQAYTRSGIREKVEAAGGEMVTMVPFKFSENAIPDGVDIKNWVFYEDALKADAFINVPIAKHHSLARLTLGMKNLMGTIENRGGLHANLGQRIADITSLVRPTLTVVDAVRILTNNGPTGGSLDDVQERDTVIASPDIVAADSYAASLFDRKPHEIAYIQKAAEMGLGRMDIENITVEEIEA